MTQDEALSILQTGANVFVTGEPGSGKTHTINRFVTWLREHGIEPDITASTGIAATHVGGSTIHSWSGIGVRRDLSKYDLDAISQNKNVSLRVRDAKVLIIDEVSMLSARTLAMVDAVCREVRGDERPFGGISVILVGDFFQLPPVSRREDAAPSSQSSFASDAGHEAFAFASDAWKRANPLVCYLSEQHRQEDETFLSFLSAVRSGEVEDEHRELLRTRYAKAPQDGITQLYSRNVDVDSLNDAELSKLEGIEKSYDMEARGPDKLSAALKRGCLSPERLKLKVGARVMFTKNDIQQHRYANGTLGTVVGFSDGLGYPVVQTLDGREFVVDPDEWRMEEGGRVLARISQVPLRLAWAMTVHKSQGMSLDAAHMNLADAFEYGQGYVALSRVRTLRGLTLAGLNARALEVHPQVREKDTEFRAASDEAREAFGTMQKDALAKMHVGFIKACGGTEKATAKATSARGKRMGPKKVTGRDETLAQIASGMNLAEMAEKRGIKSETILDHLEVLVATGKLTVAALAHLKEGKEKDIERAVRVFKTQPEAYLKPAFETLGGKVPYITLRLARLLGGFAVPAKKGENES